MFELLADGTVEILCNKFKEKGIPYGFGGIARLGEGMLKSENVIMEHYRVGSTRAILSRSFCNIDHCDDLDYIDKLFADNMKKLRHYEFFCTMADESTMQENKFCINKCVDNIVQSIREKHKHET